MNLKTRHILPLIWQYLNQPIFDSSSQSIWKFNLFWQNYQIKFLESCLQKEHMPEQQNHH